MFGYERSSRPSGDECEPMYEGSRDTLTTVVNIWQLARGPGTLQLALQVSEQLSKWWIQCPSFQHNFHLKSFATYGVGFPRPPDQVSRWQLFHFALAMREPADTKISLEISLSKIKTIQFFICVYQQELLRISSVETTLRNKTTQKKQRQVLSARKCAQRPHKLMPIFQKLPWSVLWKVIYT